MQLPIYSSQHDRGKLLGNLSWFCQCMSLHEVYSDVSLAMQTYIPKWRDGDHPDGVDVPFDVVQAKFHGPSGIKGCQGVTPSARALLLPVHSWGNCSN